MIATGKGLWGHSDFMKLWTAQAVSAFGARIAREGLPMTAVITLKAGPEAIGLFAALVLGPQAVVGLFAGSLADRLPKPPLLIGADLVRAAVLIAIPVSALFGWLSLIEIYGAGAVIGAASVVFDVADHAYLPQLIAADALMDGNAKLATTDAVAEAGGPALAGLLVQLLSPPIAVGVNALTYLGSALFLGAIRRPVSAAAPTGAVVASDAKPGALDLAGGLRVVLSHPLVRPLWLADMTRGFFGNFFAALYIIYALNVLHLTPLMLGLTIAGGGIGGIAGASLAPRLTKRFGVGPTIAFAGLSGAVTIFFIPLASGPPLVAMGFLLAAQVIGDGLQTASGIAATSLRQTVLAPAVLGRSGGAFLSGAGAFGVAGALTGGLLGAVLGPRETLLIAGAGITAGSLFVLASPLRRLQEAG